MFLTRKFLQLLVLSSLSMRVGVLFLTAYWLNKELRLLDLSRAVGHLYAIHFLFQKNSNHCVFQFRFAPPTANK
jgi:hypothetical protein